MPNRYLSRARLPFILLLIQLVVACAGRDTTEKPVELEKFDKEAEFSVLWSSKPGKGIGKHRLMLKPYVGIDTIYIADHKGRLTAIDKETGKTKWQVKTGFPFSGGIGAGAGALFIGTLDGQLVAFWQNNGEQVWQADTRSEVLSVPAFESGIVVVHTTDDSLQAFSVTNGNKIWSHSEVAPSLSLRGSSSPIIHRGGVLSGTDKGRLTTLALRDGTLLGQLPISLSPGRTEIEAMIDVNIPVLVADPVLYLASYHGRIVAIDFINGGKTLWAQDKSIFVEMDIDAEKLYAADELSHITAYNRQTGKNVWIQDKLHARPVSGTTVFEDALLIGDYDGYLHALSVADGRFIARKRLNGSGITARPIIDDDVIYVVTDNGELTALKLETDARS